MGGCSPGEARVIPHTPQHPRRGQSLSFVVYAAYFIQSQSQADTQDFRLVGNWAELCYVDRRVEQAAVEVHHVGLGL